MQRNNKRRNRRGRKARGEGQRLRVNRALWPSSLRRALTYTQLVVINNAANPAANTTFELFNLASPPAGIVGLSSLYSNTSGNVGMYNACRLLGLRAKASFTNQETFGVRVALSCGSQAPANNSLASINSQLPYTSRTGCEYAYESIGPLTGNSRADIRLVASNSRTLGVSHVKGLSDTYTNTWDTATDTAVQATSGLSLIAMIASAVNLASGVLLSLEVDLDVEFFSLNSTKTS